MTTLPASGYFTDAARTNGEAKQGFDDVRDVVSELIGGAAEATLTIAAGSVTATQAVHGIDTEGAAPADDLTHINLANVPDGRLLLIRAVNAAHVVTVKHAGVGTGQILLSGAVDFVLDDPKKYLLLIRRGTDWEEVVRGFGGDKAAARAFIGAQESLSSLLTTNGDLLTRVGGTIVRLGVGSNGQVLSTVGGLPAWAAVAPPIEVLPSAMAIGTDADHEIDLAAKTFRAEDAAAAIVLPATTIDIENAGNGGRLDSETLDPDTWYHILSGTNTSDGAFVGGFKKSIAKPAAWDNFRRHGAVLTDSLSNLTPFFQKGRRFYWQDRPRDYNASLTTLGALLTTSVPTGLEVIGIYSAIANTNTTTNGLFTSHDETDVAAGNPTDWLTVADGRTPQLNFERKTNTSGQIRQRGTTPGTQLWTVGWIDPLGVY